MRTPKPKRSFAQRLYRGARILVIGYCLLLALLVTFESNLVYLPMTGASDPKQAELPHYQLKTLDQPGGPPIIYWENTAPKNAPTLLYFHGNGGGLFLHREALDYFDQHQLHVVAMEYPGYPRGAAGSPSEALIHREAEALYDHLHQTHPRIIIWGFSLGTGVATDLAAKRAARGLILEAPFTAVVDRAAEIYPWMPVRRLMHNAYRSRDAIAKNHAPLLILHGDADRIIPLRHGQALFALANEPKTMHIYPKAGHLDLREFGAYDDARRFIQQLPH